MTEKAGSGPPDASRPIDLAREPDFRLGGVTVSPSTGRLRQGAREVRVQRRVMQVLVVFAHRHGETVSFDQLIQTCWDGRIVGDDAVHRVLVKLRQIARGFEPEPFRLETVRGIGFRLIELAADGGDAAPEPAARRGRRAKWGVPAALAALAAAALVGGVWMLAPRLITVGQSGNVEVAAFQVVGSDPALRAVAGGVDDQIVRSLSGAGVGVARRGLPGWNAEFQVSGVLQQTADQVTARPEIRDRRSGRVLWTDNFSAPASQAQSVGDIAADEVAFNLHCALQDRAAARTPFGAEVLGLYLNTCAGVRHTDEAPERMLAAARKLVAAAPRLAQAHAMHGVAAAYAAVYGAGTPDAEAKLMAEARTAADTAIRLDPRAPKAYVAREMSRPNADWALREDDLQQALAIEPDLPPPAFRYVRLLGDVGRIRRAVEVSKRDSETRDPRNTALDPREPLLLASAGDLAGARAALDRMDIVAPHRMDAVRWRVETWLGDPAKAPKPQGPNAAEAACAAAYFPARPGRTGLPPACDGVGLGLRIRLLARQGDLDGAFAMLAKINPAARGPLDFLYTPELAALRRDPRFPAAAQRLGLLAYWRLPGRAPDFCAVPAASAVCGPPN